MINFKSLLNLCIAFSLFCQIGCTEKDNSQKVSCSTSQEDLLFAYATQFSKDLDACLLTVNSLESINWLSDDSLISVANKTRLSEARIAYNTLSSYNFGPAIVDGLELNDRLNVFPANETAIATNALSGEQNIESLFKSQVGFEAIEYIVYNMDSIASSENEKALVTQHLEAQIVAVKNRVQNVNAAYSSGGYIEEFKNNTGSDDGSSLALFTNQFVQDIETRLRNNKLRIPIGKFNGGIPLTDKVEGRYSNLGLEYAALHFEQLQTLYGKSSDSLSLAAYLVCLGESDLSQSIENQFNTTANAYNQLQITNGASMVDAINNDSENLSDLIDEHQKLVALLKGPMLSALGVRINYTDSDGD
jgi:predicted lipoprotein